MVEDGNDESFIYGNGGNDKITGSISTISVERLLGGAGDDKIWMSHPDLQELDTGAGTH